MSASWKMGSQMSCMLLPAMIAACITEIKAYIDVHAAEAPTLNEAHLAVLMVNLLHAHT